jgi:TDG/mug DNA glycosylase family protein
MKTRQVNLRLEPDLIVTIEAAASAERLDRGSMIRKLLLEALEEWRLTHALRRYQAGDISIGRACEDSGRSHWEMLDLLHTRGIMQPVDVEATIDNLDLALRKLGDRVAEGSTPYDPPPSGNLVHRDVRDPARTREIQDSLPDHAPAPGGILLVGINPAPISVARGHYYQGKLGRRLWKRLEGLGLLRGPMVGLEDEAFIRAGHGLTDLVKRPTAGARELSPHERRIGADRLREVIAEWKPRLVLFAFKQAAALALGDGKVKPGPCGEIAGVPAFLLSGPYASRDVAKAIDDELRRILKS